jgi:hypothetical protein
MAPLHSNASYTVYMQSNLRLKGIVSQDFAILFCIELDRDMMFLIGPDQVYF